jgi:hypothetical protein
MEYLIRTNSDEDIKNLRNECQRLKVKFIEPDGKSLSRYNLSLFDIESLDLSKVSVFENMLKNGRSVNLRRLVSNDSVLKWDR